jgi:hypothetical protein
MPIRATHLACPRLASSPAAPAPGLRPRTSTARTAGASRRAARAVAATAALALASPASAWIWPEHRDIAAEAVKDLPPADRQALDALWVQLHQAAGKQACPSLVDAGAEPDVKFGEWDKICVDFASFPALAADHSCSAADLWDDVSKEAWALKVVWVAARTKAWFARVKTDAEHEDVWNLSHLAMQYVDPRYLTRAEGNSAHFLLPREPVGKKETIDDYLERVLSPKADINATGLYADYHMLALRLAAMWSKASPAERPELARRALTAEGVALHFLEDSFSSGHYAATWGGSAWAKGTHDLYSKIGLTTMTWSGELFASHGDAHMTERDMKVAAVTVKQSLVQLATAAQGRTPIPDGPLTAEEKAVEALDFCKADHLPPPPADRVARGAAAMVLRSSPIPAGGPGEIHPPRARAEMGPFVGAVSGYSLGVAMGGYDSWANTRLRSEFEVGARAGYGLEGLLTSNMDGQIWAQASLLADPAQLDLGCSTCDGGRRKNTVLPRVPARSSLKLAVRMPYYVVPGDLVLIAPVLALVAPQAVQNVVFASASGGLLALQRRLSSPAGTFQFMAGREVGLTLWGYVGQTNQFIVTQGPTQDPSGVTTYKSLEWDFPVLEYIPPRVFATSLSLAAIFQLGFSVEFPQNATYQASGSTAPPTPYSLGPSWNVYLRFRLDARKYFGSSADWEPAGGD